MAQKHGHCLKNQGNKLIILEYIWTINENYMWRKRKTIAPKLYKVLDILAIVKSIRLSRQNKCKEKRMKFY